MTAFRLVGPADSTIKWSWAVTPAARTWLDIRAEFGCGIPVPGDPALNRAGAGMPNPERV